MLELYEEINNTNTLELPYCPKDENDAVRPDCPDHAIWMKLLMDEINQFNDYKVLKSSLKVEEPGYEMKVKFVFEVKFDNNFEVKRKVRIVACGYSQVKGVNYNSTYAPTPSMLSVKLLFNLSAILKLHVCSFDVHGAFLEGENDYPNFIHLPGILFSDGMKRRFRVLASMYGECQSAYLFNDKMSKILISYGFKQCMIVKTLFMLAEGSDFIIINIHVDDGYTTSNSMELVEKIYDMLDKEFVQKIERYVPVKKFVGLEVNYSDGGILLNQQLYIHKMLDNAGVEIDKYHMEVPMRPGLSLRTLQPNSNNASLLEHTGKFRYLCDRTRYDLLTSTGEVSCGGATDPSDKHVQTVENMYKYLSCTINKCLHFGGNVIKPFGFCDASYNSGFARLAGALFLNLFSGAFHCFSQNDSTVSKSICESEIKAMDKLFSFIFEMLEILEFLHHKFNEPVPIYCDNEVAKELVETIKNPDKTKHIIRIIEFLREKINDGIVKVIFIPTEFNVADVLTKPLPEPQFSKFINILQNGFNGVEISETYVTWDAIVEEFCII